MKIPQRARQRGLSPQMTPLIDIVFLLNIFFLVASYFIRNQAQEEIELPTASQAENLDEGQARLTVTIDATGQLFLGTNPIDRLQFDEQLTAAVLEAEGRPFELRLRGDQRTPFEEIEPLLMSAARNHVTTLRFAVRPE
ncbi:MAG: biopolymer transporter ExbD [Planctomycetaceae bacterium]|nr:biopolymer transporter ExbD [Planctomycetaceae bacterium]